MLNIKNLCVKINKRDIINNFNLNINSGEVHVIMGPNGSGKSTLAYTLAGKDNYEIIDGFVLLNKKNIKNMSIEERALQGLFLAFQHPIDIPGVNNLYFLRTMMNARNVFLGKKEVDAFDFLKNIKVKINRLKMNEDFLHRSVNDGFSGGEKKRNEILQISLLNPKLIILDEMDSGLDVDALKLVGENLNKMRIRENSMLIVTHYRRLLDFIKPDYVHVLMGGRIVCSGTGTLALKLDRKGYNWIDQL